MRRRALAVLGCPDCHGPLRLLTQHSDEEVRAGALECPVDGVRFPIVDGIPRLVRAEAVADLEAFAASYGRAWHEGGWGSRDETYLLVLPFRDTSGRQRSSWKVKARSMNALFRLLDLRPLRRVLDLGSGMGWLSYHLARRSYEVYAIDALLDDKLGLRAAEAYVRTGVHFERIWAEMERPPFQDACMDVVVCNASLHYLESVRTALAAISRVLVPGGIFVVMNSPVHRDPRSARAAETDARDRLVRLGAASDVASRYHHFALDELRELVSSSFASFNEYPFDPGVAFRLSRRIKGLVLGIELASFPIFWAEKRTSWRSAH